MWKYEKKVRFHKNVTQFFRLENKKENKCEKLRELKYYIIRIVG